MEKRYASLGTETGDSAVRWDWDDMGSTRVFSREGASGNSRESLSDKERLGDTPFICVCWIAYIKFLRNILIFIENKFAIENNFYLRKINRRELTLFSQSAAICFLKFFLRLTGVVIVVPLVDPTGLTCWGVTWFDFDSGSSLVWIGFGDPSLSKSYSSTVKAAGLPDITGISVSDRFTLATVSPLFPLGESFFVSNTRILTSAHRFLGKIGFPGFNFDLNWFASFSICSRRSDEIGLSRGVVGPIRTPFSPSS